MEHSIPVPYNKNFFVKPFKGIKCPQNIQIADPDIYNRNTDMLFYYFSCSTAADYYPGAVFFRSQRGRNCTFNVFFIRQDNKIMLFGKLFGNLNEFSIGKNGISALAHYTTLILL